MMLVRQQPRDRLADQLGAVITANPGLLHPLAGSVPALFAFVCGSGAGIVPIGAFDGRPVAEPEHPLIARATTFMTEIRADRGGSAAGAERGRVDAR